MTQSEVGRPKRGRESISDMVRSLGLVAVVIAATLIFVPGLLHPNKSQRFAGVDYTDYVVGFRQLTGKVALRPYSLPYGWKSNAASLTGTKTTAHLHIGWAAPGGHFAGLEESVTDPAAFVSSTLGVPMNAPTNTVVIGDEKWQTLTSGRGEYSLTRARAGVIFVITGSATEAQLRLLAEALQSPTPVQASPSATG